MFNAGDEFKIGGEVYCLIERLGQGGQCQVWRAERRRDKHVVALRTLMTSFIGADGRPLPRSLAELEALKALLEQEIVLLQRLDALAARRGILPLSAHGEIEVTLALNPPRPLTLPVMIQPLCRAGNLRRYVCDATPQARSCSLQEWWSWFCDLLTALAYLHGQQMIHRDIKPDNLLLDQNPDEQIARLYLGDFGLARQAQAGQEYTRMAAGSMAYIAPEQILPVKIDRHTGEPQYLKTPASDIYAAALVMSALVSGRITAHQIFTGAEDAQVSLRYRHQQELAEDGQGLLGKIGGITPDELSRLREALLAKVQDLKQDFSLLSQADIADAMAAVIEKMLHPDYRQRPSAADLLREDIPLIDALLAQPRQERIQAITLHSDNGKNIPPGEKARFRLSVTGACWVKEGWLQVLWRGNSLPVQQVDREGNPVVAQGFPAGGHDLFFQVTLPDEINEYRLDVSVLGTEAEAKILYRRVLSCAAPEKAGDKELALFYYFRPEKFREYCKAHSPDRAFLEKLQAEYPEETVIAQALQDLETPAPSPSRRDGVFSVCCEGWRNLGRTRLGGIIGVSLIILGVGAGIYTLPEDKETAANTVSSHPAAVPDAPVATESRFVPKGQCAVVIASRKTPAEMAQYLEKDETAKTYRSSLTLFVYKNGRYAASIGTIAAADKDLWLQRKKAQGDIPEDSFCAPGQDLREKVDWQVLFSPAMNPADDGSDADMSEDSLFLPPGDEPFIPAGKCGVIVASRDTPAGIAAYIARHIPPDRRQFMEVFLYKNQKYAVSVGTIPLADKDSWLQRQKADGNIPADSFCSRGNDIVRAVDWQALLDDSAGEVSTPPTPVAQDDDSDLPANLEAATQVFDRWAKNHHAVSEAALQAALARLNVAAENGDINANLWLGYFWQAQNRLATAASYYRRAAAAGDKNAQRWINDYQRQTE